MPNDPVDAGAARPVDAHALVRALARLQAAPEAPWLHTEVARRMGQRLQLLRRVPASVADWWPRTGGSAGILRQVLPNAACIGIADHERPQAAAKVRRRPPRGLSQLGSGPSLTQERVGQARTPWWLPQRWRRHAELVASAELAAASQELVWANMLLHHTSRPVELLRRWHGCLAVDGILMFSTLGPGTLERLRRLYAEEAWGPPMAELVDMHDLGDMLVAAGFVDPVMDQETLRLTWGKAEEALIELRSLGSNAHPHRMAGLRTPRWRQRLLEGLKRVATRAGREGIELEFEVVYGHAVKAAPRLRVESESRIGLDEMRQSLRAARPRPSV